jgi:hypothetical protein
VSGYNQTVKPTVLLAAALLLISCGKDIQNNEAVRQAVVEDLTRRQAQTGLDMNTMQVDVSSVSFRKNAADAVVSFTPKNAEGGGLRMNYVLERKGDKWVVTGRQASGMSSHGNVPLPDAGDGTGQALPPGHPAVDPKAGTGTALPPGHPPVDPNAPPKNPGTVK